MLKILGLSRLLPEEDAQDDNDVNEEEVAEEGEQNDAEEEISIDDELIDALLNSFPGIRFLAPTIFLSPFTIARSII